MMPGERRRIAERVRDRYRRARKELTIEETDLTVEERFDLELTGIDKYILEQWGIQL